MVNKVLYPRAILAPPVELLYKAEVPIAILPETVFVNKAEVPIAILEQPVIFVFSDNSPNAILLAPALEEYGETYTQEL